MSTSFINVDYSSDSGMKDVREMIRSLLFRYLASSVELHSVCRRDHVDEYCGVKGHGRDWFARIEVCGRFQAVLLLDH